MTEAERQAIAQQRTEGFFGYVNHVINQVNAPYRSGLPISYGYKVLERRKEQNAEAVSQKEAGSVD